MPTDSVTATSSATASRSFTKCSVLANPRFCCCRPGRSSTLGIGRCRSLTSRGIAGWSRSTGAAMAARIGLSEPEAYAESEFAADALAVMDATQTDRAIIVGFSMGAQRGLLLAANHPERVDAAVFIGPNYHGGRTATYRSERSMTGKPSSTPTRAGRSTTSTIGCATTAGFVDFFISTDVHRAALDEADRGLRRLGPRNDGRDAHAD